MKIDKPDNPLPVSRIAEGMPHAAPKGKSNPPPSAQQPGSTSVSLGHAATQLHSMEIDMASTPAIDEAKVAEVKQAISDGRFKVNPGIVADRLIETVRDLINKGA